ncbi:MAG TPA: alpha/beta fold hydrolase [Noviherbaspirillum sp.]
MHPMSSGLRWWFETLDEVRKRRGMAMDRMGFGPVETPSRIVLSTAGMRLRYYGGAADGDIALIVPAPIKRHYIWDLAPECSVVQRVLEAGMQVYLIEWADPTETEVAEADFGLEQYADALIARCDEAIRRRHGAGKLFVLSHSLGGVLASIYAALHPDRVDGLVLIEAPLHFSRASGSFTPLVAFGPPAGSVARLFGRVPGSVLSMTSVIASPSTFHFERRADFMASLGSAARTRTHLQVERWTLDEAPMPGRLFEDVVEQLYREDRFMQGTLTIGTRRVGPEHLVSPLLAVYDPHSRVIPPESILPFVERAASRSKKLLRYEGDTGIALTHVGALMGESAQHRLWPDILAWLTGMENGTVTRH